MAQKIVIGASCMRYWEAAVDAAAAGNSRAAGENLRKYNDCMFKVITRGIARNLALAPPTLKPRRPKGTNRPSTG